MGSGSGRDVETWRCTATAVGAATRCRIRRSARSATAGASGRPGRSTRCGDVCARRLLTAGGSFRHPSARGGLTDVEVDGLRWQYRSTEANRGRRRQPLPGQSCGGDDGQSADRYPTGVGPTESQHRLHLGHHGTGNRPAPGADAPLRPGLISAIDHRTPGQLPGDRADHHAATATGLPCRTGQLRSVIGAAMVAPGRAVPAHRQGGLDRDPRPGGGVGTLRRH